ncbi:MAG: histidinol-phosphatase HisJ family protein [Erysipelotrichaceae bacterium]|nr:histidinol-phosphatase HisJ family protein [Erysipelotrichaceae bacterium]
MSFEDYHVHTHFSNDSAYDMEQVIQDAAALGINELCFTDHVDYGIKQDWDKASPEYLAKATSATLNDDDWRPGIEWCVLNVNYPEFFTAFEKMKNKYKDQISLKAGMEFGVQTHTIPEFQKLYNRYKDKWDFILLSIHQVDNKEFWTQEFQAGHTQKEYNRAYYEEMLKVVKEYKDYSVLAHMDLIVRYDKAGKFPFEEVSDLIEEILKIVIADGKGLEINTSSVRYKMNTLHPSAEILKMYKDLGGTIITFGSDTHKPEHLGVGIEEQKKLVKELGFHQYCTFDKMKPNFIKL